MIGANRLAVDVGGMFTDVVRLDDDGALRFGEVATTDVPARAVLESITRSAITEWQWIRVRSWSTKRARRHGGPQGGYAYSLRS